MLHYVIDAQLMAQNRNPRWNSYIITFEALTLEVTALVGYMALRTPSVYQV